MNHKPIFYNEAIKLIKHVALKGDSSLEHQSLSENVNPWIRIKYRDLLIKINVYYHMIYFGNISIAVPPLLIKNHPQHRPLNVLSNYLAKIFDEKDKRKQKYLKGNSLEIYNKHLNDYKKNHEG